VQKDDINKTSSSQLWLDPTRENKSQVPPCPSCNKITKGFLENISWTLPSLQKTQSVIYDPAVRRSN